MTARHIEVVRLCRLTSSRGLPHPLPLSLKGEGRRHRARASRAASAAEVGAKRTARSDQKQMSRDRPPYTPVDDDKAPLSLQGEGPGVRQKW